MENKPALTQEQRLAYIGDMADLETREFTLKKAVESLKTTNTHMCAELKRLSNECNALEARKNQLYRIFQEKHPSEKPPVKPNEPDKPEGYDQFYQKYRNKKPNTRYVTVGGIIGRFFAFLGGSALFLTFFTVIIVIFLYALDVFGIYTYYGDETQIAVIGIAPACICALLGIIIPYVKGYKRYRTHKILYNQYFPYINAFETFTKAMITYKKETESYQLHFKNYTEAEQEYQEKKNIYEDTQCKFSFITNANNAQITRLQESITIINTRKHELYDIGIIPPDYREMDCVIMLHQIFRNGLKDNMADAILLYEERIFRQEIIRGIDKIYDMLGQLNDSMRAIESRLIEVKQELQMIGSDMSNQLAAIVDNQSRILSEMEDASEAQAAYAAAQEQWQREQLAETRASRYAAEAVQRSNEKYEWYMDQHRRGFM